MQILQLTRRCYRLYFLLVPLFRVFVLNLLDAVLFTLITFDALPLPGLLPVVRRESAERQGERLCTQWLLHIVFTDCENFLYSRLIGGPMPKPTTPEPEIPDSSHLISTESNAYLNGLFSELVQQMNRYGELTRGLLSLQARIELAEKTLCLTRDHLAMSIQNTDSATPREWGPILSGVRFAGVRLADACAMLLQEKKRATPEELLIGLNKSMYRFRTNSPLREIHAALLRQSFAKREGKTWVWTGTPEKQLPMRLRVVERPTLDAPEAEPERKEGQK